MMWRSKIWALIIAVFICTSISAQNSQVLYHMNLPQNHLLNPALRPSNSLYIGLPAITGINLNINNNFLNFSDIFSQGRSDSLFTFLHPDNDPDDFLSKIKEKNSLEPQLSIQLFGLGFSAGEGNYIFLDIIDRVEGNLVLPGDLFRLALKGNEAFAGSSIDLSSLRGDLRYYREYGLGFSRNFTNRLRIGVKGKLIYGIAGVSIDNRDLEIKVGEDYTHTLNTDVDINLSAPVRVYTDDDNNLDSIEFIGDERFETGRGIADFILGKKNMGFGLDIGATYNLTDKILLSAAITDFGFINWKKDVTNLNAKSRFEFSGIDMTDVINGTKSIDEAADEMLDSLKNSFQLKDSYDAFTTVLPLGISIGGSYNLTNYFSVGLLSYTRVIGKQMKESLTMSANLNLGNAFSTSLSYTASNHRYDNIGLGLAFRPGIFQFFLISDRIPLTFNRIITDDDGHGNESSILLPSSWNTIHLRLGMNLAFGNRVKKKNDKPMLGTE